MVCSGEQQKDVTEQVRATCKPPSQPGRTCAAADITCGPSVSIGQKGQGLRAPGLDCSASAPFVSPQFVALPATANSLSGEPIVPGSKVLLKSLKTNKYCRVVQAGEAEQIKCDVDDPAQATPIDYTGTGFAYKVRPLVPLPCCGFNTRVHCRRWTSSRRCRCSCRASRSPTPAPRSPCIWEVRAHPSPSAQVSALCCC
jgi:hypothetical protein